MSLFQITEDIDSGKVLAQEEFKINKHDYINDLIEKSKKFHLNLLIKT